MKNLLIAATMTGLLSVTLPAAHAGELEKLEKVCAALNDGKGTRLHVLSVDDALKLLKDKGYKASKMDKDSISMTYEGSKILLVRYDDGDWQSYYGTSGIYMTPAQINEWNRTKRLNRAYIDSDGNPVIESDLLVGDGITDGQFMNFVKVFIDVIRPQFKAFVIDKGSTKKPGK